MINFLRISNNIRLGDYLHADGTINDVASKDVIGVCVIPSKFLPDGYARFMTLKKNVSRWGSEDRILNDNRLEGLPGKDLQYPLSWGTSSSIISPYLPNDTLNPEFHKNLFVGNAFQDYKGYKNTQVFREKSQYYLKGENAFDSCFWISPSYRRSEWYLPAIGELALLPEKISPINISMEKAIAVGAVGVNFPDGYCWSSSERIKQDAWILSIYDGYVGPFLKRNLCQIRAFLAL